MLTNLLDPPYHFTYFSTAYQTRHLGSWFPVYNLSLTQLDEICKTNRGNKKLSNNIFVKISPDLGKLFILTWPTQIFCSVQS